MTVVRGSDAVCKNCGKPLRYYSTEWVHEWTRQAHCDLPPRMAEPRRTR